MARNAITPVKIVIPVVLLIALLLTCIAITVLDEGSWLPATSNASADKPETRQIAQADSTPAVPESGSLLPSPTPDLPHPLPALRSGAENYTVQAGDSLNMIAQRYYVSVNDIVKANQLEHPDLLEVGQTLTIPAPKPEISAPAFKIIPDSALVFGPESANFDLAKFVQAKGGYLASYKEDVDDRSLSGVKILERVAQEYSVNPRLLLAVLEYQSGWVTQSKPAKSAQDFPIGLLDENRKGLYKQLAWAANNLNRGFYLWRVNGVPVWNLADGSMASIDPRINAGTAGVQHFFAQLLDGNQWQAAVGANGLFKVYETLFGDPFAYATEPLLPADLQQPQMQLPLEPGQAWSFTGGPHGGWGTGSAWAALDFAPPGEPLGCVQSDAWVTAVADGLIVRTVNGAVVQDLDGDGLEQTGWTVLYMHIEERERVRPGTYLHAGDRIGHPSCEGGVSNGTHLHLARRYNGEWIPADQSLPFVLGGWVSSGSGGEYDGYLKRGKRIVEAWNGRRPENAIRR